MKKNNYQSICFIVLLMLSMIAGGCSMTRQSYQNDDIPVLSQEELKRPYTTLGRIQVTREVWVVDDALTPDLRAWGLAAVKQEAEKMGADAVTFFEITGRTITDSLFPLTEFRATGFAIKFKMEKI